VVPWACWLTMASIGVGTVSSINIVISCYVQCKSLSIAGDTDCDGVHMENSDLGWEVG
jgi:hypothetical protein